MRINAAVLRFVMGSAIAATMFGCSGSTLPGMDAEAQDVHPLLENPVTPFKSPIKHVVLILKENHTFDSYFTHFPGVASNPPANVVRPAAPDGALPTDLDHSWSGGYKAYNKGAMDGFEPGAYIAYSEAQIPNYWQYARNFVLWDNFFSTTLGPSDPGYLGVVAGYSPIIDNNPGCADPTRMDTVYDPVTCTATRQPACFTTPTVVDGLEAKGFTWRSYATPGYLDASGFSFFERHYRARQLFDLPATIADLSDPKQTQNPNYILNYLKSGDIANVVFVFANDGELSEHPPSAVCPGENFTVQMVNAIMQSSAWNNTAILINWDDSGGFYDHVAPVPETCQNGDAWPFGFINPGFRLPFIVVSPYAKAGAVIHNHAEQASISAFIEATFGLKPMSAVNPAARDGRSDNLLSSFDFTQPPQAPLVLQPRTCP